MKPYAYALIVFFATLAYAIVRYNLFGGVSPAHIPLFITNKAVSVSALAMLGAAIISKSLENKKSFGIIGFSLAGVHLILSLTLLTPAYLPKLFLSEEGYKKLSFTGETGILLGSMAFITLVALVWPRSFFQTLSLVKWAPRIARVIVVLVALHCFAFGFSGWFTPSSWYGFMPPITLLSFLFALTALITNLVRER